MIRLAAGKEEAGSQLAPLVEVIEPKDACLVSAVCPSFCLFQDMNSSFRKAWRLIVVFTAVIACA